MELYAIQGHKNSCDAETCEAARRHDSATISLYVLCADRRGGVDHYPCLCCWKIVACSERDMAYATIFALLVCFGSR